MAANMVVTQAPDTPGFYSQFASKSSFILGGIQISAGVLTSLLSFVIIAAFGGTRFISNIVAHIVFGVIMIIAGALGITAGKLKTTGPIVGFMVTSIIASIFAVYAFVAFCVIAIGVTVALSGDPLGRVLIAVMYVFVVAYLVETIVSIWSAAICCCSALCCQRKQTPGVVVAYQQVKRPVDDGV